MCTIVVIHRVHPTIPVIVAANRDEFYERSALPPEVRGEAADGSRIVAGRDVRGGGTWLGATGSGTFAAITNQRAWAVPPPRPHSRGAIVGDALVRGRPAAIDAYLEELEPGRTLPFNLIYGDAQRLVVAYGRDEGIERVELAAGVHVLTNDRLGSPLMPKAGWLEAKVEPVAGESWERLRPALEGLLADDAVPPKDAVPEPPPAARFGPELVQRLQAVCIRTPDYGTVSATILALGADRLLEHRYADGAPGDVPWMDVTELYALDAER